MRSSNDIQHYSSTSSSTDATTALAGRCHEVLVLHPLPSELGENSVKPGASFIIVIQSIVPITGLLVAIPVGCGGVQCRKCLAQADNARQLVREQYKVNSVRHVLHLLLVVLTYLEVPFESKPLVDKHEHDYDGTHRYDHINKIKASREGAYEERTEDDEQPSQDELPRLNVDPRARRINTCSLRAAIELRCNFSPCIRWMMF